MLVQDRCLRRSCLLSSSVENVSILPALSCGVCSCPNLVKAYLIAQMKNTLLTDSAVIADVVGIV